ncbi:hypothetical protein EMCRGX_G017650 [Ephydatia muelleri]|eukprot:Em0012g168a
MTVNLNDVESAVIGDFVALEAIQSCEREYKQRLAANSMTEEVKFTYAWHLIKSQYKNDITKGIGLMSELVKKGKDQRDFLYYIAVGYYKMEDYSAASDCIDRVLEIEPSNSQAKQVKALISKKQFRDTLLGYGILGGAAVAGAAVAVGAAALLALGLSRKH